MNDSIRNTLEQFAAGNFKARADRTIEMGETVNQLGDALEKLVEELMENQAGNCMSMFEVVSTMSRMADGMSHMDERTLAMAAATEEMATTNEQIATASEDAVNLSTQAVEAANSGANSVQSAMDLLSELAERARTAMQEVEQLAQFSGEIGTIVASIQRIAGQTNMLALNATIEAARAGEAGKGFAVVAGEVKGLSQQTARAASDISTKIDQLQNEIDSMVHMFSANVEHAESGGAAAEDAGHSMQEVIAAFSSVSEQVSHIKAAAGDQGEASREIAVRTHEVSELVSNANHEIAHTVRQMRELEGGIKGQLDSLSQNQVSKGVLSLAKTDHMFWKKRLVDMLLGLEQINADEVTDHHHCRLGKWYYADGEQAFGRDPAFGELEQPHAEVHQLARLAVEQFNRGERDAAAETIRKIDGPSSSVVNLLGKLQGQ